MENLIQLMKQRFEESAAGGNENVRQIMEYFLSEGYSQEEVNAAFNAILSEHDPNELN
jgi:SOS response regulatory protein OraA/RecX